MDAAMMRWLLFVVLIAECCIGPYSLVQGDAPDETKLFKGCPENTMHPTVGENLVRGGHTLQQEAEEHDDLGKAIATAKANNIFREKIIPKGKDLGLDYNESLVIFCFTLDTMKFRSEFNKALREGDDQKYPIYHYFLDSGVKKLAKKQEFRKQQVYHGNRLFFTFTMKNTTFPGFTSASLKLNEEGCLFSESCTVFNITTRQGAYIGFLSGYSDEEEVLIPPYEVFLIGHYQEKNGMKSMQMTTTYFPHSLTYIYAVYFIMGSCFLLGLWFLVLSH